MDVIILVEPGPAEGFAVLCEQEILFDIPSGIVGKIIGDDDSVLICSESVQTLNMLRVLAAYKLISKLKLNINH